MRVSSSAGGRPASSDLVLGSSAGASGSRGCDSIEGEGEGKAKVKASRPKPTRPCFVGRRYLPSPSSFYLCRFAALGTLLPLRFLKCESVTSRRCPLSIWTEVAVAGIAAPDLPPFSGDLKSAHGDTDQKYRPVGLFQGSDKGPINQAKMQQVI